MEHESGDEYIRRIAGYIRTHEQGLAAAGLSRRRRTKTPPDTSVFNPLGWFASDSGIPANVKPVVLSFDSHHLFYLLMRIEALGISIGSLDVRVDNPSRPMNYMNIFPDADRSDALSLMSFRSSLSAVSRLSLGAGWWGRPPPPSLDMELKYMYSAFTKLPALSLHAPEARLIAELANDAPNHNALPLDAFKNLQTLQCVDIDPRTLLGWDRLAESLRSLTVNKSGLEDVSDIFIGAVADDQARREGRSSDARARKVASRQSSFYSTRLPETVPEDAEDAEESPDTPSAEEAPSPNSPAELSSLKWAFLRHLSLADNALTFLPSSPLPYLTSVTHLDLSSNLLVSVPSGLSSLYNLVSLNLSDNMIDSVLGIYTMLGQVLQLNLSRNRLESICGLERLLALERVDLRENVVEESAEIGRLATLPNIAEVWIDGNPLAELEESYRIRCFDYFSKEGKSILLDGASPSMYEKMYMSTPPSQQMTSSRPPSVAYSPPVVAVGNSPRHAPIHDSPMQHASSPSPTSQTASPHTAAAVGRGRRRKNKRIVDLDSGTETSETAVSRSGSYAPAPSEVGRIASPLSSAPRDNESPSNPAASETPPDKVTISPSSVTPILRPAPKPRHTRHFSEFAPGVNPSFDDVPPHVARTGSMRKSAAVKQATRRTRLSASVYEPSSAENKAGQFAEADAFRARIEALRSDMGDGWLKVFNQSQMGSPGVPSG